MSAGGALGGLAVSLIAPMVFKSFFEWPLSLLVGFALAGWVAYRGLSKGVTQSFRLGLGVVTLVLVAVGLFFIQRWKLDFEPTVERNRNFYGTLVVTQDETDPKDTGGKAEKYHALWCSGTKHGQQFLSPELRREPLTYYGKETAVGQLLTGLKNKPDAKVGIIGMGTATLACYAEPGQTYRFYEINPEVERIAKQHFTFISDLQARGAKYEMALGDARLMLDHEPDQHFDALVLDAFSGDSVPVHLLTKEAFTIYGRHLQPKGVIAVHITNHYLNLAPVVARLAKEFGYQTTRLCVDPGDLPGHYKPDYMLLSKDEEFIKAHPPVLPKIVVDQDVPLWTDHAHNLFQILYKN